MIGYEKADEAEDQEQTALEPVVIWISRIVRAQGFAYIGFAIGMAIALGGCSPQPNKLAPEPPYMGQRPAAVEVTPSGYLRDLEAK